MKKKTTKRSESKEWPGQKWPEYLEYPPKKRQEYIDRWKKWLKENDARYCGE